MGVLLFVGIAFNLFEISEFPLLFPLVALMVVFNFSVQNGQEKEIGENDHVAQQGESDEACASQGSGFQRVSQHFQMVDDDAPVDEKSCDQQEGGGIDEQDEDPSQDEEECNEKGNQQQQSEERVDAELGCFSIDHGVERLCCRYRAAAVKYGCRFPGVFNLGYS
jgi:hypothetical protein